MKKSGHDPLPGQLKSAPASQLALEGEASSKIAIGTEGAGTVKVLLVDDNVTVRESASEYLQAAGYVVTLANNGFDALARVVQSRPDVVLADITMPRLDGYQMCALLKSNSDYRHIPVIMITGKDGLLDQTRAHLVGSDAHISKPFTAQALTQAVSEAACSLSEGLG